MNTEATIVSTTRAGRNGGHHRRPRHVRLVSATNASDRRAFWSCKVGYALDAMDTQFLSFVIPTLIATWGLSKGEAGLIGTVTLLTSALGGWARRHAVRPHRPGQDAADHDCLVRVFTLLCAFAQNFSQLLSRAG